MFGLGGKKQKSKGALPKKLSYEQARSTLEEQNLASKRELAVRDDTPPEALYYLATDADASVRARVAANPSTPRQADAVLVQDVDEDVRVELARKIGRLMPDMDKETAERVRDMTLQVMDALSQDHVTRVRRILAEEIRDCPAAPKRIILRLAQDHEEKVAVPILEYSPLLNEDDLIELITAGLASGKLQAIARRDSLPERVSDEIAASLDIPAVATLLRNRSAKVRRETLEQLAEQAEQIAELQEPVAARPDLSIRAIRRISGFIATELLSELVERGDLDPETKSFLSKRVRERIANPQATQEKVEDDSALATVAKVDADGQLNDDFITQALRRNTPLLVKAALQHRTGLTADAVDRILRSGSVKAVCGLTWNADFSADTAVAIQAKLCGVPRARQMLPDEDGGYALSDADLAWQVECFADE